jgi:hypothetical protein
MNCRISGSAHHCANKKLGAAGSLYDRYPYMGAGRPLEMDQKGGGLPASAATENPGGDEVFLYLPCD